MTATKATSILQERAGKAAKVFKVPVKKVLATLNDMGIEDDDMGVKLLDAETTTQKDIYVALRGDFDAAKNVQIKAAAAILKGNDPFDTKRPELPVVDQDKESGVSTIAKLLKDSRPLEQLKDKEILERYVEDREYEVEQELHRRASYQPFIVLKENGKHEPGQEPIDVEKSLDLLKNSRKRTNPTIIPYGNTVVPVYRVTELNINDRMIELCPLCGETLYKGYCESCELNFGSIGVDERAYMKVVVDDSSKFDVNSFSDRRALYASALKDLDDLKKTWPSMAKHFEELKISGDLPRLVIIENRPSRQVADPFHRNKGNNSY